MAADPAPKRRRLEGGEALALSGSASAAVHGDALLLEEGGWESSTDADVAPPLSLSTTFTSSEIPGQGHIYSRYTTPSRSRCEALLGAVEGTPEAPAHAVLYSSGLAACFAVLSRLLPARVAISGGYHGTHAVLAQLRRLSVGARFESVPLPPPEGLAAALGPGDVAWLETPLNPTCDVADVAAYVAAAKAVGGVRVVVDGTFAPPPLQRPLALGADAVMHATTKYLAGHSDALGGAICVSNEDLAKELRSDRAALGSTPGSLEVWLLMRSIRTLHLRVERQSKTAAELAEWLYAATVAKDHALSGLVHAVHHPSLPSHPGHAVAQRQMPGGFGGCFSLELSTEEAAKALPAALTLFRDATSLGGVESLVEWRRKYDANVSPLLLRVSVGLEDLEHLRADLRRGVRRASGRE